MANTDPAHWFLNDGETVLQPSFTKNNRVTPHIDGKSYFEQLYHRIEALGNDGYLHISGWRLTPEVKLNPTLSDLSIEEVLLSKIDDGVEVRSMLWNVPLTIGSVAVAHGNENLAITTHINARRLVGRETPFAILDDRVSPGKFGSHHQKFIVLGDSLNQFAFLGGIDIAPDRWDTPEHNQSAARQREFFDGWHDIQCELEGPAVSHIWQTFKDRWNDERLPNNFLNSGSARPPKITTDNVINEIPDATHSVQLLRTFSCRSQAGIGEARAFPFAPNGEFTYQNGLVKAIEKAEHYIYIEDQYFWPCDVVDALSAAVARGVSVILLLTKNYDVPGLEPYHNFLRQFAINKLNEAERIRGQKLVFVYHLEQDILDAGEVSYDLIYLHAKTIIIDDCYAVIGSANIGNRSMTTDSELGIAIVDSKTVRKTIKGDAQTVCDFATTYRKALWKEHLKISNDDIFEIEDPLNDDGSPKGFPKRLGEKIGHTVIHQVPVPQLCYPSIIPNLFMNAETIC